MRKATSLRRILVPTLALLGLLASQASAQVLFSGIRVDANTPGGLWAVTSANSNPVAVPGSAGVLDNLSCMHLHPSDPNRFYAGTYGRPSHDKSGPCAILEVTLGGGAVRSVKTLNTQPLNEDYTPGIAVLGPYVYFLGRHSLGLVPRAGGAAREVIELPSWVDARGMVSDGKDLYVVADARSVIRVSPVHLTIQGFVALDRQSDEELQSISIGNSGSLLVVTAHPNGRGRLLSFDTVSGVQDAEYHLPMQGVRSASQDPATGDIHLVGGLTATVSAHGVIQNGRFSLNPNVRLPNALASVMVLGRRPFYEVGVPCRGENGRPPRIGIEGQVSTSTTSQLTLRAGIRRFAVGVFGHELGTLPIPQVPIPGAPECSLHVHPVVFLPALTDGQGVARIPLPPAPDLSVRLGLFRVQWIVSTGGTGAAVSALARIPVVE